MGSMGGYLNDLDRESRQNSTNSGEIRMRTEQEFKNLQEEVERLTAAL